MKLTIGWTLLCLISALHLYWAVGGVWPGRNRQELSAVVIGDRPLPGPAACIAVALLLITGPYFFPRVAPLVFCLRGILGLFDVHLRPAIKGTPYERLNYQIYSPLSFLIAVLLWG